MLERVKTGERRIVGDVVLDDDDPADR